MGKTVVNTAVIKINDKDVVNSFNGIYGEVLRLRKGLKKLTPGTEAFIKKAAELKEAEKHFNKVKTEIYQVNNVLNKSTGFWKSLSNQIFKFGNVANGIFTANMIEGALNIISSKSIKVTNELIKVADAMTDVQKTTGMALEEVKNLWDAFDEMDTRTSKLNRLKIAEIGGRLGVPKEEMLSFVQEIDKAYVALGDSFEGGLEGVVEQLGKIKGLFNDTKELSYADAINKVGSALNTLAAQGTASEGNISQFALRVGALSDSLKPSIDKVLGLGVAFEESGIDAQIAASGYSNFIRNAAENIDKFAYSMNMSVAEAKELINTNSEEFFLRFAQGMRDIPSDETAKILSSLSLNSLEVQKAVGAAANNTNKFSKAMRTAGIEMDKTASLQNEFNTKNNNAPAILEKLKNVWNDFFSSSNMINLFEDFIKLIGALTGVSRSAGNGVKEFKENLLFLVQVLKIVGYAMIGYQSDLILSAKLMGNLTKATLLQNVVEKAKAYWYGVVNTAAATYHITIALLTGNIQKARNVMIAFNAATKANPLGLLISLLTTAVAAIYVYNQHFSDAAKLRKELNKFEKQSAENASAEITNLKLAYKKLRDKNIAEKERLEILKELQSTYPSYFENLTTEDFLVGKATDSYNELRKAIVSSARAKAASKVLEERKTKRIERDAALAKKNRRRRKDT